MSLNRVPILTWGTMTVSVGNLLAVPSVSLAFFLLWTDRQFGTHFFRPNSGGHPLLWQHLFWMFAHPWVYVVVLPAMGLVSDSLPFFCRRPLVGYARGRDRHGDDHGARLRRLAAPHVRNRHSVPGARLLQRRVLRDRHSERDRRVRVDRDDLDRPPGADLGLSLLCRLHRDVRHRRRLGRGHRRRAGRPASHRHLFRGGAHPLRADRHQPLRGARRACTSGSRR